MTSWSKITSNHVNHCYPSPSWIIWQRIKGPILPGIMCYIHTYIRDKCWYMKQPIVALNSYPIPFTLQIQLHLTSSSVLNPNPTRVVTIFQTRTRLYMLWRRFWRNEMPPSFFMKLLCLTIIGPIVFMSKKLYWKIVEKKNCLVSPTPSGWGLELFEQPSNRYIRTYIYTYITLAQLAEAVEYTDCTSAEG